MGVPVMRAAGRMEMAEVKRGALFRELRTTTAARQPAPVLSPGAVVPSRRELASGRRNLRKAPAVDKVAATGTAYMGMQPVRD